MEIYLSAWYGLTKVLISRCLAHISIDIIEFDKLSRLVIGTHPTLMAGGQALFGQQGRWLSDVKRDSAYIINN